MEQPSASSKVTVEYFDPSGVYPLLSPGLLPRLPLRNLHWESHAGPLRSIESLHVDLVASADTPPLSSPSNLDLARVKSTDSNASGDDGFRTQNLGKGSVEAKRPDSRSGGGAKVPLKGRRHQIRGVRQTPYLKVYFLRCDDNEIYKSDARKQVREWIKEHATRAQSSSKGSPQENHDAFEWMIIHVVVPNTAAASQPRFSTKGSSTLLEKLRADFNGTSKSVIDRVAQVRIGVNDVPYDILPKVVPAIPGSYAESPRDHDDSWQDLLSKFRSLILASFDMRVTQYEDDIKEKDAQRALPGWNFCTFFVLKEGLARGFESVGLVEDALVGYDELSIGLDAVIAERIENGPHPASGGAFLPPTEDIKALVDHGRSAFLRESGVALDDAEEPIDLQSSNDSKPVNIDEIAISASKKSYRELILANNISIFDFRCYIFARQLALLLRLGNAWSSRDELLAKIKEQGDSSLLGVAARHPPPQPMHDAENLSVLGEVCRRALEFIASVSRVMRDDLMASCLSTGDSGTGTAPRVFSKTDTITLQVIDNVVASFTFSVAQQILAQTATTSLPIPPSSLIPSNSSTTEFLGHEQKTAIPEPKTMMHPARMSSLSTVHSPASPGVLPDSRSPSVQEQAHSAFLKAGLEDLAAKRAALYVLSRTVLAQLGSHRAWLAGWDAISDLPNSNGSFEDVDLDDKGESEHNLLAKLIPTLHGLDNKLLRAALDHRDDFYRLYETLTDKALRHYTVANYIQSVQSNITELALLKYHLKDHSAAASYFYRMTTYYGDGGWDFIEANMLVLYSRCLKELGRNDDYVRVALRLLTKGALADKHRSVQKAAAIEVPDADSQIPLDGYLEELVKILPSVNHEVAVPLQSFFSTVKVDDAVSYHGKANGFSLGITLRYHLMDELKIDKFKALLVPVSPEQGRELLLESQSPMTASNGLVRAQLHSNINIPGVYTVKRLELSSSKMTMEYDEEISSQVLSLPGPRKLLNCPPILLYHRPDDFVVTLTASRTMYLDRNRSLEIEIFSGWNSVIEGKLHLRAATAGLRLQTSDVQSMGEPLLEIRKKSDPGVVRFGRLAPHTTAKLRMPFSLERELNDLNIKIEVSYITDAGQFFDANVQSLSIMLPLGVNVQDVFKHNTLFSKFSISSATSSPLRLLGSKLDDSDVFESSKGADLSNPVLVFPKQPASLLYRIRRRETPVPLSSSGRKREKAAFSLSVNYICLEEEIENAVVADLKVFLQTTAFWHFSRLILPIVLQQLRLRFSPAGLERIALLGEVSTGLLADVKWHDYLTGLGRTEEGDMVADKLWRCLQDWIAHRRTIPLEQLTTDENTISRSRCIIIPVEIPSVTVVHTANLKILQDSITGDEFVLVANKPISALLQIRWTRTWDTKREGGSVQETSFVYELSSSHDTWLIGGKRKGHFTIPNDVPISKSTITFPVLLIPITQGYLPYPTLDIKPVPQAKTNTTEEIKPGRWQASQATSSKDKEPDPVVNCETDYKNTGEVIRVISNAQKTTVSLDASGPHGGVLLLESEARLVGSPLVS